MKTKKIIEIVNLRNKKSTCCPEVRQGWNSLLEEILHANGDYKGFGYYTNFDLPVALNPGIRYVADKSGLRSPCDNRQERFKNCDDTRRHYY